MNANATTTARGGARRWARLVPWAWLHKSGLLCCLARRPRWYCWNYVHPQGCNKGGDCVVAHNHCERSTRSMRSTTSTIWIWQLLVFRGRRLGLGTCGGLDCERVGDATAAGRQILRSTIPPIYPCEYTLSEEQAPDSLTSLQSLVGS